MKDWDEYKTKLDYPKKGDFTNIFAYKEGVIVAKMSLAEWRAMEQHPEHSAFEKVVDEEAYKAASTAYRGDIQRLTKLFEKDLYEDYGVSEHPKRKEAFRLAWDRGHSSGFSEIYNEFQDLVVLIKD